MGMEPDEQGIFYLLIVAAGPGGGEFVYNASLTVLQSSNVAVAGTDPILGIAVPQGFATYNSHGKVINLLSTANNAFFQYQDTGAAGTQGALILSVASNSGTDPVTAHAYQAGLYGIDPAFGDTIQTVGANINLGQVAYTRTADLVAHTPADNAHNPFIQVDAPEQTTASHMQMQWQGASPDGTRLAQALLGPVAGAAQLAPTSQAMLEVQGGAGQIVMKLLADVAAESIIITNIPGDTFSRFLITASGGQAWGSGAATQDSSLTRLSANRLGISTADLAIHTAGRGLQVAEGTNAKAGTAVLSAGSKVVATTAVTASSRIIVACQALGTVTVASAYDTTTRVAGTSFTIHASQATDTSTVYWFIVEPG